MSQPPLKDRLEKLIKDLEGIQSVLGVLAGNLKTHTATLNELLKTLGDPQ